MQINHLVEPTRHAAKARYRLWFYGRSSSLSWHWEKWTWKACENTHYDHFSCLLCVCFCACCLFLLRWSLLCYTTCPFFLFSVLALFVISLLLSVSILFYILFFFTFTVLYIPMYFSPWFSNRFSQCYYIGAFEIKIKFNYLLFWFYYTFPYVSTTLTRFPFSACPVGGWVGGWVDGWEHSQGDGVWMQ